MRIRKRPLQIPTDPSLHLHASNGREESEEERARGGLHPNWDLPINLHGWWRRRDPILAQVLQDPPTFDPHPTTWIPSPPASHLNGCCIPSPHPTHVQVLQEEEEEEEEVELDLHKTWNAQVNSNKRNGSSSGAQVSGGTVIGGATVDGRGCDGLKSFPLKKRRGRCEIGEEKAMAKVMASAKASTALKGNTSIDISSRNNKSSDDVVVKEERGGPMDGNVDGKKRRSPAVLMEGSRCSRVNGRGWRCSQQTLVGYSLCEHHLGKGRMRSMSSVRGQAGGNKPMKAPTVGEASMVSSLLQNQEEQERQQYLGVNSLQEEEEPAKKGGKKLWMVKARSITSLLDESNYSLTTTRPPYGDKAVV